MISLPIKKLVLKDWIQISIIWTVVALSMSTQLYLNGAGRQTNTSWAIMFAKQLPAWYLFLLLTPVIFYFVERCPIDNSYWKRNVIKQGCTAFAILLLFSNFRLWAFAYSAGRDVTAFSGITYFHAYLSQFTWDLAVYIIVSVTVFANQANVRRREQQQYATETRLRNIELESELKTAQLEALKLQLNPHFLFNTLNTVNALIRADDKTRSIAVTTRLGEFLRSTLYTSHQPFVTLKEEMKFLDQYLEIETLRFSDRLIIARELTDESLMVHVPHFILQPILENAMKHGIAKQINANTIAINSQISAGNLIIRIFNEGRPLTLNGQEPEHWGIGLKNVYSRLMKLYDNRFSFSIYNHSERAGVEVMIVVPVLET
jgi:hypothetical protein